MNGQDSGRTSLALEEVDNTSARAGRRSDGQRDAIQTSDINKVVIKYWLVPWFPIFFSMLYDFATKSDCI